MRIAVFNQKGGVGKTTTTLNLAAAISRQGGDPLLLDLDPQCHLSAIHGELQTDPDRTLFGFYQGLRTLDELAIPWENLGRLIPAHSRLIKVDSIYGKGPTILNKLRVGLDALDGSRAEKTEGSESEGGEQNVLIDCCPYMGVLALNAIFACDLLLIPISTDYLSLQAANQMTKTLAHLEPVLKRRLERRYLLTRYDRRRKMSEEIQSQLRESYGDEVCQTIIYENVSIAESPSKNRDIFSQNPSSRGAMEYLNLYQELQQQGWL
jgi:chromosome partitioning protein